MNELGQKGEQLAKEYLQNNGYTILHANWFFGHKELDIVARKGDTLHIVEIKTRSTNWNEEGFAVSRKKQKNIIEATEAYINKFDISFEIQFDIIYIISDTNIQLQYIEDAFSIYD